MFSCLYLENSLPLNINKQIYFKKKVLIPQLHIEYTLASFSSKPDCDELSSVKFFNSRMRPPCLSGPTLMDTQFAPSSDRAIILKNQFWARSHRCNWYYTRKRIPEKLNSTSTKMHLLVLALRFVLFHDTWSDIFNSKFKILAEVPKMF